MMTMANPLPKMIIQMGIMGGSVSARSNPVKAADPSKIVSLRCRSVFINISNDTADNMETMITVSAGIPKKKRPQRLVGMRASMTWIMMEETSCGFRI